jgi:signal transduction histidine kinase
MSRPDSSTAPLRELRRQMHIIWVSIAIPAFVLVIVLWWMGSIVIEHALALHWLIPVAAVLIIVGAIALGVERVHRIAQQLEERERQLRSAHEQLITVDRLASAGMMAASIAHEVNNPLTTIKILIHALREQIPKASQGTADLEVIRGEIDKISTLVLRLMQFGRPTEPELILVDLNPTLGRVVELIRPKAAQERVEVVEQHAPLPSVMADPAQLGQVFLNILLNAIDAASPGGTIRVSSHANSDGGAGVTFWNSGPGLDPALQEEIFEPFFTTKATGTGLGLPIARMIMERHGGTIHAIGHGEHGTSFRITLPKAQKDH